MTDETSQAQRQGLLSGIGPAIITASVVLGPGSILAASKIGHEFGYRMTWVLAVAVLLMIGMTALSARLGVVLDGTLCDELARRGGRPVAVIAGVSVFLIASCFQFGNNLGVLAAFEPFYQAESKAASPSKFEWLPLLAIVNLNVLVIVALFGFGALYRPVERLMKLLVGLMIIGFAGNLLLVRPDLALILAGLVPNFPEGAAETLLPRWQDDGVEDKLSAVTAMIATTFSVAGAFYQSYLVRQKGWTRENLRQGLVDSTVGICTLGLITLIILVTAASVLHRNREVGSLTSVADVARQLEPAFGRGATILFSLGIFAGAFSSFLVNAMIGGSMLSDGLGLGGYLDQRWPKLFTVLALAVGLNVAGYMHLTGQSAPVQLIIFAQALTVLGLPVLAGVMLWLATRPDLSGKRRVPGWIKLLGAVGLLLTLFLAARTATRLLLPVLYG